MGERKVRVRDGVRARVRVGVGAAWGLSEVMLVPHTKVCGSPMRPGSTLSRTRMLIMRAVSSSTQMFTPGCRFCEVRFFRKSAWCMHGASMVCVPGVCTAQAWCACRVCACETRRVARRVVCLALVCPRERGDH